MNREVERFILRCTSLEIQKFLRELNQREVLILQQELGVYGQRKIDGNISKRMQALLREAESIQVDTKEIQALETKTLAYFQSEDFSEYHNMKVKAVVSVMRTMRKKNIPEEYVRTFSIAKYEDKAEVENVEESWYKIHLLEKNYGFLQDTIIPYLKNGKVYLCVLINGKEHIIGELIRYSKFEHMIADHELRQLAVMVKEEKGYKEEGKNLTKKLEDKEWQLVFKKKYEELLATGKGTDLVEIYTKMNEIGKEMIVRRLLPEGSVVNLDLQKGVYLQFIFYEYGTLVDVVDPYKHQRNFVIDEEAAKEEDISVLKIYSTIGEKQNNIHFE